MSSIACRNPSPPRTTPLLPTTETALNKLERNTRKNQTLLPPTLSSQLICEKFKTLLVGHENAQLEDGLCHYCNPHYPEGRGCPCFGTPANGGTYNSRSIGCTNARCLFGEQTWEAELTRSMGNGLAIAATLKKRIDQGDFVLVPIAADPSR